MKPLFPFFFFTFSSFLLFAHQLRSNLELPRKNKLILGAKPSCSFILPCWISHILLTRSHFVISQLSFFPLLFLLFLPYSSYFLHFLFFHSAQCHVRSHSNVFDSSLTFPILEKNYGVLLVLRCKEINQQLQELV